MTTPDIDRIQTATENDTCKRCGWQIEPGQHIADSGDDAHPFVCIPCAEEVAVNAAIAERDKRIANLRTEWRVAGMKIRSLSGGWTTETSNWYQTRQMAESVMRVRGGRLQCRYVSEPEDVK